MSFTDDLEALGESEVRRRLANGGFSDPGTRSYVAAEKWLHDRELELAAATSLRATEIAEKALSTAIEANRLASEDLAAARSSAASASEQARWARWAAIIATIAAIIAAKDQILALIFGPH